MDCIEAYSSFLIIGIPDNLRATYGATDGELAAFLVTVASLSGWLEDCATADELLEALRHGFTLVNAGIVCRDVYRREKLEVEKELEPVI